MSQQNIKSRCVVDSVLLPASWRRYISRSRSRRITLDGSQLARWMGWTWRWVSCLLIFGRTERSVKLSHPGMRQRRSLLREAAHKSIVACSDSPSLEPPPSGNVRSQPSDLKRQGRCPLGAVFARQETTGVGGSGPDLVGQATTPPIRSALRCSRPEQTDYMRDIPCTARLAAPPASLDEDRNALFQMCIVSGDGRKSNLEWKGLRRLEISPQMLTVSGGEPCPTTLGKLIRFDAVMGKGIAAPFRSIRGQISKAEFMSQADSQSNPLRSGSTQHLDSGLRTGVSAPIIWAVLATQNLRQTSPSPHCCLPSGHTY